MAAMNSTARRVALSTPVAVLLSLLVAGVTLGYTWSAPYAFTSSGNGWARGIAGLDSSTAVVAYMDWNGSGYSVHVRRTGDTGVTWTAPATLSTAGTDVAVSGLNPNVDVVWIENGSVMYARSIDTGFTFSPPLAMSKAGGTVLDLSVTRGPNDMVAVAWQNGKTDAINVRVSRDNGATFAPATFASNKKDMGTAVAIGDGVVYLAYAVSATGLRVRRSLDQGFTWSGATTITNNGYPITGQFSIAATGAFAFIAYEVKNPAYPGSGALRERLTSNSGSSWSGEQILGKNAWKTSSPKIATDGDFVQLVFDQVISGRTGIHYKESPDGVHWSAAESVSTTGHDPFVAYAGVRLVMYELGTGNAVIRRGT
jgi:hypothetical protein